MLAPFLLVFAARDCNELNPEGGSKLPHSKVDNRRKIMEGNLIRLRNVEKSYPLRAGKFFVLRRINLDVNEGDFVTIMGPSGAGKSTLLSILGMLDGDWSGEYYLSDQPVHKLNLKQRSELGKRNIGFVFQQYHLLDELTVAENLDLPLSYRNIKSSERQSVVADTLDKFQIVAKKDLYPNQLSGGQQQLVAVARAIVAKPKLILADEPTGSPAYQPGKRNHGSVQEAKRRRHHDHSGHSQRKLGGLRQKNHQDCGRLDCWD